MVDVTDLVRETYGLTASTVYSYTTERCRLLPGYIHLSSNFRIDDHYTLFPGYRSIAAIVDIRNGVHFRISQQADSGRSPPSWI